MATPPRCVTALEIPPMATDVLVMAPAYPAVAVLPDPVAPSSTPIPPPHPLRPQPGPPPPPHRPEDAPPRRRPPPAPQRLPLIPIADRARVRNAHEPNRAAIVAHPNDRRPRAHRVPVPRRRSNPHRVRRA